MMDLEIFSEYIIRVSRWGETRVRCWVLQSVTVPRCSVSVTTHFLLTDHPGPGKSLKALSPSVCVERLGPGGWLACCLVLTDARGNYCYYTMIDAMIYKLGYQPHQAQSATNTNICIQQQHPN